MRIMPAFNIMYNELDNAGIESINAFQYDTGIDPTNTIRHNATLVLYQDAETSHMREGHMQDRRREICNSRVAFASPRTKVRNLLNLHVQ